MSRESHEQMKLMTMLRIPNLKGKESNTLFLIGNGFDLYHGLKTSFRDFHDWLIKYRYADFVRDMELLFPQISNGSLLLWKDFETALGGGDPLKIHDVFFQGIDDYLYNTDVQERVVNRIKPILNNIRLLLREWTKDLPINSVKRKPELDIITDESLYLSFNYTLLLEKVYMVNPIRILHIHNCIDDNKQLITGHRSYYSDNDADDININVVESTNRIAKELNGLAKPVDNIINDNQAFFKSLENITNVIVFGLSISPIDRLYFTEVFHHVHDNACWFFVCKDDKAKNYYKKLVDDYNDIQKKMIGGSQYYLKMSQCNCNYIIEE